MQPNRTEETGRSATEWREEASDYLREFRLRSDHYAHDRYLLWRSYTDILSKYYFTPTVEDLGTIQDIAKAKSEPNLYRCEAYSVLGFLYQKRREFEVALANYRDCLHLAETATDLERSKMVKGLDGTHEVRVGELLDVFKDTAQDILRGAEAGSLNAETMQAYAMVLGLTSDKIRHLYTLGGKDLLCCYWSLNLPHLWHLINLQGEHCDCCGKSRKEAGVVHFEHCDRCKKAFYCSETCQAKQWKAGHKKYCRKPGQIKAGDYVRTWGIVSKPELNDKLARVEGPDPKKDGRWKVLISAYAQPVSLAAAKLEHCRPLK